MTDIDEQTMTKVTGSLAPLRGASRHYSVDVAATVNQDKLLAGLPSKYATSVPYDTPPILNVSLRML